MDEIIDQEVDDWCSTFRRALADPVDQWLNAMVADFSREIGGADPQERKRLRELVRQVTAMSSALEFLDRIQDGSDESLPPITTSLAVMRDTAVRELVYVSMLNRITALPDWRHRQ